jgi:hypothetical protein
MYVAHTGLTKSFPFRLGGSYSAFQVDQREEQREIGTGSIADFFVLRHLRNCDYTIHPLFSPTWVLDSLFYWKHSAVHPTDFDHIEEKDR